MKISNLLNHFILSTWIAIVAILSLQNITPVTLKFLTFISFPIPFGIVLAMSLAGGMTLGSWLPFLFPEKKKTMKGVRNKPKSRRPPTKNPREDLEEDIFEEIEDNGEDWEAKPPKEW